MNHSKLAVIFFFFFFFFALFIENNVCLLKIMCVYFLQFRTSLKIHEKRIHFKKITVSRQFSIREIGNFARIS